MSRPPADGRSPALGGALAEIYRGMSSRRRRQFAIVMVLMALGALAELTVLGAILPFLSLLSDPDGVRAYPLAARFFDAVGAGTASELVLTATILFTVAAVAAGVVRLGLVYGSQTFAFRLAHDIGVQIQQRLLSQPYAYHVASNSSAFVAALDKVQQLLFNVLIQLMLAFTAAIISVFIIAALVYIDPVVAMSAAVGFALIYVIVSLLGRRRLNRNSEIINTAYAERVQAVQESLGGIRDVILDQSQPVYLEYFRMIDDRLRRAQAANAFIAAAPRFALETAGMVLIAFLAYVLWNRDGGLAGALPVLGALALGAQRLLPLLQQIYYGWASVTGSAAVVHDVVDLLRLPMPQAEAAPASDFVFEREIRFAGVGFAYPGRVEPVLSDIDLVIPKGARIAIIGQTGSGKSTLTDLLMGLLEPTDGTLSVDGVPLAGSARTGWQRQVAHVPQAIFLSDTSIERNIAFGVPEGEIDRARVLEAARQAQIHDFIAGLPEGYATSVGERGVRLSGGQRQRLGIARALYKGAPVLILDEATSALDTATETEVIAAVQGLSERITIIMIAHRLSTIESCELVVRLADGRIVERRQGGGAAAATA